MSSQLEQSVSKAEFTTKEAVAEAAKNSLEEAKIRHREELATRDSSLQTAREEMQRQMVRLNEDARAMVEREKERREAWADDQHRQVEQKHERVHQEYQRVVEAKLSALQNAHESKLDEARRADQEESRLKAHVGDQMAMMTQSHMPLVAHHQAIAAAKSSASAEFEAKTREMQTRLEAQADARVKEVEEQKQTEYTMAMMNVRQGIKKLESQVESEKRQRLDLEGVLAEERNNLSRYRMQADEDEGKRNALVMHLEEASQAISKLKAMVAAEARRREEAMGRLQVEVAAREEMEQQVARISEQRDDLEEALGSERESVGRLNDEVTKGRGEIQEMQLRISESGGALSMASTDKEHLMSSMDKMVAQHTEELTKAQANTAAAHEETAQVQQHAAHEMEAERQRLVDVVSQCDAESERLGMELRRRTGELEQAQSDLEEAQRRLAATERERLETETEGQLIQSEVEDLRRFRSSSISNLEEQQDSVQKRVASAEKKQRRATQDAEETRRAAERKVRGNQVKVQKAAQALLGKIAPLREGIAVLKSTTEVELLGVKGEVQRGLREVQWQFRTALQWAVEQSKSTSNTEQRRFQRELEGQLVNAEQNHHDVINRVRTESSAQISALETQERETREGLVSMKRQLADAQRELASAKADSADLVVSKLQFEDQVRREEKNRHKDTMWCVACGVCGVLYAIANTTIAFLPLLPPLFSPAWARAGQAQRLGARAGRGIEGTELIGTPF